MTDNNEPTTRRDFLAKGIGPLFGAATGMITGIVGFDVIKPEKPPKPLYHDNRIGNQMAHLNARLSGLEKTFLVVSCMFVGGLCGAYVTNFDHRKGSGADQSQDDMNCEI